MARLLEAAATAAAMAALVTLYSTTSSLWMVGSSAASTPTMVIPAPSTALARMMERDVIGTLATTPALSPQRLDRDSTALTARALSLQTVKGGVDVLGAQYIFKMTYFDVYLMGAWTLFNKILVTET